jgi:hypothetical protein
MGNPFCLQLGTERNTGREGESVWWKKYREID